ncbi:MAG TPA: Wzz/FepE/Etk N-terminal domain-containing protein, partial [Candidatus Ozemobacteraceae bacterium]|nr:Wzz/FepE/Etk N-terminal domain-containing protein [Candidatus Ozemobacteraceae bacterium]
MTTTQTNDIDTESLKKEIKQELIKREIMMGMDDDEVDLFELGKVLWKHWRMVLVMPIVVAVIAALYSLTMPNLFKSKATIFVHSKGVGGMSSLLSSLPMGGMLGGIGGGGAEYLTAYLNSDDMSSRIITQFGVATNPILMGEKPPEDIKRDDLIQLVHNIVGISSDKDGLISITAETTSASFSCDLASAYIDNLNMYAKGPATQKRIFIESQLAKVSKELVEAEIKFKEFQDKNRLVSIDDQAKAAVESLVKLES